MKLPCALCGDSGYVMGHWLIRMRRLSNNTVLSEAPERITLERYLELAAVLPHDKADWRDEDGYLYAGARRCGCQPKPTPGKPQPKRKAKAKQQQPSTATGEQERFKWLHD